jgi:hypothetical protein
VLSVKYGLNLYIFFFPLALQPTVGLYFAALSRGYSLVYEVS